MTIPHNKIPYSKDIENFVRKYALTGKSCHAIFDLAAAQGFQDMPNSRQTFSDKYKWVVDQIKMDKISKVADKVYARAMGVNADGDPDVANPDGYFPAQELILSTQAGWSKTQVNVDIDANGDEDSGAKEALLAALGLDLDDEK